MTSTEWLLIGVMVFAGILIVSCLFVGDGHYDDGHISED